MARSDVALRNLVSLSPRFFRSVHLERDFYAQDSADGFVVTRGVISTLTELSKGIYDTSHRAKCISGPYGSGKSALALYFAKLLDKAPSNGLRSKARQTLGELAERMLPQNNAGYITILATGTRENISRSLVRSLQQSLEKSGRKSILNDLAQRHSDTFNTPVPDTRDVVTLYEDLARVAKEMDDALGVVVVVDELGKMLEYAALHPDDSDIQVLQEMAEAASRSHDHPLWFITILHQQFSQYASRLGRRHQNEWQKIQQRFYDVSCSLDNLDALRLAASALSSTSKEEICKNKVIGDSAHACKRLAPRGSSKDFENLCVSCYPLHPTALLLLPGLFRKFGQNERSLFSFLSGNEPFSLSDWVRRHDFDQEAPVFLRLPDLYDYACNTLIGGAPTPQIARAWAEVEDSIIRLGDASPVVVDTLKCIGLLNLVGDSARISASEETLKLALVSSTQPESLIDDALATLERKRIIQFRRYRNAYKLWEGSDIDIDELLVKAYQTLPLHSVSLTVARELCPSNPIVARRHSFRTGMLRSFSVVPCAGAEALSILETNNTSDGRIIQCLVETEEDQKSFISTLQWQRDPSVVALIAKETDELAEAARDVAALEWVKKNTPALAGDRAARQELNERRLEAETAFRSEWDRIFSPGSEDATCFWCGDEQKDLTPREFAFLLSRACDATFPHAPIVQNELINRRVLSSAAAKARRCLVEAMISNSDQPGLGFTGYPPERSIYESLLLRSGIHREVDGRWTFCRPDESDLGLQKAWDYIVDLNHYKGLKPKLVSDLVSELSSSPYGVADGFIPVLLCACLIANSATMALYEDKLFVSELTVPVMERLMRRPENFAVVAYELGGERLSIVERFARGYGVHCAVLPIVRSLYARMGSLPRYTEITNNLSPEAVAVREAIQRAKSPEHLLFVELPKALSCRPFNPVVDGDSSTENVEQFFVKLNTAFDALVDCYPNLLNRIKNGIAKVFDTDVDQADWRDIVVSRASALYKVASESRLRTIMVRARDRQIGDQEYLESIASGITGQPPNRWNQADEDDFDRLVPQLAAQVRSTESTQGLKSSLRDGEDGYVLSIEGIDGQPVRRLIRFSQTEKEHIRQLVEQLAKSDTFLTDKHMLLAALTEAARRLATDSEDGTSEDGDVATT